MLFKRFVIKKNERGVLLRDGDFERILESGRYRLFDPLNRLTVQTWKLDSAMTEMAQVEYLRATDAASAEKHFEYVALGEDQAGLRFENDVLVEIVAPGTRKAFWKGLVRHRLETVDLTADYRLADALAAKLAARPRAATGVEGVLLARVPAYHVGVLRVDGKVVRLLAPGLEGFWRFNRDVQVELVDTRLQNMEVSGQEILTRDKVGLRVNLAATWRHADVLLAFERLAKPADHLYRELQFGLREAVGTRSLDELLEDKQLIDKSVGEHVARKLAGFGIEVGSVGVKDIVLPGEMKTILAKVVEAEKAAEATVIRRREETAATRSLLNTAKVMEDNPTALRLKELETLERVAERIDRISVFGGLDQVLNGLVTIKPQ